MNFLRVSLLLTVVFSAAALSAAERVFDVTGVIVGRVADGRLIIEHDEIPGYMAAMTMAFSVADAKEAAALKEGDVVRFRYRVGETASVAESFMVTGRKASAVAAQPAVARAPVKRLRAGDTVPAFELLDENGRAFTDAALRDRFTVVTFIFTRCPVPEYCPALAMKFGVLQDALRAEKALPAPVRLLSVTLDPEFDRPEVLAAYGKAVGARPSAWGFATGETDAVMALARAFSVYTERNGALLDHTLCTALIGPDGRVVEIWRGQAWNKDDVINAVRSFARP